MTASTPEAGRYEKLDRIAVGGMGEVWRARDTKLGREVALKLLKPELAQETTFRQRFDAEARNAASLHHPAIATVFDFGEDAEGRPFLVMELVRGKPLSDLLQPGRAMPPDRARELVGQVAQALAQAHAIGMVHRDVKPANVLVTPDGSVKVTDFGIARAADASALTGTGEMIGTPHYISPEQARGESATPASDVYSLGVVLYELLAGSRPFVADTPVATALAHIRTPPPDLPATVPADLREVVRRSLAKDPAQRYPDAAAMGRALGEQEIADVAAPTQAVAAPEPADRTAVMPAVVASPPTPVTPAPATRSEKRGREGSGLTPWWIVAAVVVVIVVVAAVVLANRGGSTGDQPTTPRASDTGSPTPTSSTTSRTPTPTPSRSPSRTPTPSRTPSPTRTPSATPTPTPTPTPTSTSPTPAASPTSGSS